MLIKEECRSKKLAVIVRMWICLTLIANMRAPISVEGIMSVPVSAVLEDIGHILHLLGLQPEKGFLWM